MHTFADTPKTSKHSKCPKATVPARSHFGNSLDMTSIPYLQRTVGDQVVQGMLETSTGDVEGCSSTTNNAQFGHDFSQIPVFSQMPLKIQAKLTVNTPGDEYEQEADHVARQVMSMPEPQSQPFCPCGGGCLSCQSKQPSKEPDNLQTKGLGASDTGHAAAPPIVHEVLRSPGQPLDLATRAFFEPRFGHDFSQVRVHADAKAADSAKAVNALGYTVGRHMVFSTGQYAPNNPQGKRLLAHELTHVMQQRNASPLGAFELGKDDSAYEREADEFATTPNHAGAALSETPQVLARYNPPAPNTEDCSKDQINALNNALAVARTWVNVATPKVVSYAYFYANPRVTAVPANPAVHVPTRNALHDNFHTTRNGVLSIRDGFVELQAALNNSITFECEGQGCEDQAYVRGAFAAIRRVGDIHVCPPWFNCRDYYRRVTTLIHERAHQYPGATDNAYEWEGGYATLGVDDAIDNAESYAVAARQIYHGGARGPGSPAC